MAALQRVLVIALFDLRRAYVKPLSLLLLVVMPVLAALGLSALAGSMGNGAPPVLVVVDESGGPAADAYREALTAVPFTVVPARRQEASAWIAAGDLHHAIVVPAGFGPSDGHDIEVLTRADEAGNAEPPVVGWARAVAGRVAAGLPPTGALSERQTPRGGSDGGDAVPMRLAFAVFLVVSLLVLIGRGAAFQRERLERRLARTVVAGARTNEVLAAFVVSLLVAGGVQAVAFFGATGALGMPWLAGGGASFVATVAGTLLAVAGIAAAITGFARTEAQVLVWSYVAPSLVVMLGGAFWPIDSAPAALQQLARLTPAYWSLEALAGGTIYAGWSTQVVPLAMLVLVGIVGMVAGVQALRRADL